MNTEKDIKNIIKPIIFWVGFPACGLLVKKVADEFKDELIIVATRPEVPFQGLEEYLGHKIIWFNNPNDIWEHREEFRDRNLVIHTGWRYEGWLKYDKFVKKKNNAKVIVSVDNRFRGDLRQMFGAIYFRLYLKRFFDAVLVPGKSGIKLMKFLGMDESKIYTGLYGAYEGIFQEVTPIENRNKEFLFIGQLIKRKSVDILIRAFKEYRKNGGSWNLRLVGNGPLGDICHGDGIILEDFAQPNEIAKKMNHAKALVLLSKDDNWGTVVCEAAACGMNILTTKTVGASEDIVREGINGTILNDITVSNIQKALFYFENLTEKILKDGSSVSKEIAKKYDSEAYFNSFMKMIVDSTK